MCEGEMMNFMNKWAAHDGLNQPMKENNRKWQLFYGNKSDKKETYLSFCKCLWFTIRNSHTLTHLKTKRKSDFV